MIRTDTCIFIRLTYTILCLSLLQNHFLDNKQINRPCRDRLNDSLCICGLLGVTDTDELLLRDINNTTYAF